jgi:hypothetical protein
MYAGGEAEVIKLRSSGIRIAREPIGRIPPRLYTGDGNVDRARIHSADRNLDVPVDGRPPAADAPQID